MAALRTLIQMARGNMIGFRAATCGALKTIGPENLDQNFGASALCTESFLPFNQTYSGICIARTHLIYHIDLAEKYNLYAEFCIEPLKSMLCGTLLQFTP